MSVERKLRLTDQERQMYKSERLDNFRWISRIVASYSSVPLTDAEKVPDELCKQLSDVGQFAEIMYSTLPIGDLLEHHKTLSPPGFPLEGYPALHGTILETSIIGDVAKLPAAIFWRPSHRQIIVSICGTKLAKQALQDIRVLKTKHPSGKGQVHTGFWSLYVGLRGQLKSTLRGEIEKRNPAEIVLTGHSMGGAVAYLLGIDLLAEVKASASGALSPTLLCSSETGSQDPGSALTIKLVTFGIPRVGDQRLVEYWHHLVESYGGELVFEYSVRTYNDGVPALPPLAFGYRHFSREPIYADNNALYFIPPNESERSLFRIGGKDADDTPDSNPTRFPRGGHNYYGGRELERLQRRLTWLEKSDFFKKDEKWKDRYLYLAEGKPGRHLPRS